MQVEYLFAPLRSGDSCDRRIEDHGLISPCEVCHARGGNRGEWVARASADEAIEGTLSPVLLSKLTSTFRGGEGTNDVLEESHTDDSMQFHGHESATGASEDADQLVPDTAGALRHWLTTSCSQSQDDAWVCSSQDRREFDDGDTIHEQDECAFDIMSMEDEINNVTQMRPGTPETVCASPKAFTPRIFCEGKKRALPLCFDDTTPKRSKRAVKKQEPPTVGKDQRKDCASPLPVCKRVVSPKRDKERSKQHTQTPRLARERWDEERDRLREECHQAGVLNEELRERLEQTREMFYIGAQNECLLRFFYISIAREYLCDVEFAEGGVPSAYGFLKFRVEGHFVNEFQSRLTSLFNITMPEVYKDAIPRKTLLTALTRFGMKPAAQGANMWFKAYKGEVPFSFQVCQGKPLKRHEKRASTEKKTKKN